MRQGDEVRVRASGLERIVVVERVVSKRVGPPIAATCFIDNSPPPPPKEVLASVPKRDRGAGRPTKRERRDITKLVTRARNSLPTDDELKGGLG